MIHILCRRGDLNGRYDMEIVDVIDELEQLRGFEISKRSEEIFLHLTAPNDLKAALREMCKHNTGYLDTDGKIIRPKERWVFRTEKNDPILGAALYTNDNGKLSATKDAVTAVTITSTESFELRSTFLPVLDVNAWAGPVATWGSGGDYPTLAALAADVTTITSAIAIAYQISAVTESSYSLFGNTVGTKKMILDGRGFLTTLSTGDEFINTYGSLTTGTIEITGFVTIRTATASATGRRHIYANNAAGNVLIHNNILNGNGGTITDAGKGIEVKGAAINVECYDNIAFGFKNSDGTGWGIRYWSNASLKSQNNTAWNCDKGIEATVAIDNSANDAAFDCTTCFVTPENIGTFSKGASSDTSGSEAGLRSLSSAVVFQSVTPGADGFLVPVKKKALHSAGAADVVTDSRWYANDVRKLDERDIGAKGIDRGSPSVPCVFKLGDSLSMDNGEIDGYYTRLGADYPTWTLKWTGLNSKSTESTITNGYYQIAISERPDVIVANWGLHDVYGEETPAVSEEDYTTNLTTIFSAFEAAGIPCVYLATTPTDDTEEPNRPNDRIDTYNGLAYSALTTVMSNGKYVYIDINASLKSLWVPVEDYLYDGTHPNEAGATIQYNALKSDLVFYILSFIPGESVAAANKNISTSGSLILSI